MARSISYSASGSARSVRAWAEVRGAVRRRLIETLGFTLLGASLLLLLALVTYDPQDPSLDTAIDSAPHNFLGHDGAVLADLLRQSLGIAAFLIPIVLFAWSFRLLLNRPVRFMR